MGKTFTVVDGCNGYYIYYDPVPALGGKCCGDGVDEPYGEVGTGLFRDRWEDDVNSAPAEVFEAYFPKLADLIVFDCGDEFADRFCIVVPGTVMSYHNGKALPMGLGLSHNPDSPQGFSQWGACDPVYMEAREDTTRISFMDLPVNVQQHAVERLEDYL